MAPVIGFHASHEQFRPDRLLRLVQSAEAAGFGAAMCSDHWAPWSEAQGESGFAWSWLGAALQATSLELGVVNAPGQRYHPAIIAQAAATLNVMFPERFWIAVGSGQLLNEHITGERWPAKAERNERLRESAEIMRRLWAGEAVSHDGHVTVSEATLWTRPERPPTLVGAAVTPETAGWVATWADALITVVQADEQLDRIVEAFRSNGGEGKPMYLQVHLAYAPTESEARDAAFAQWGQNCLPNSVMTDLSHPEQIKAAAQHVTPQDIDDAVRISSDIGRHVEWLQRELERGFDRLYLHEVGPDQERFVETFGREVLPNSAERACDDRSLMADLTARERAKLPDSAFASIDSAGRRRLPIHDEPHVRNALARFNRVVFDDEAARDRARSRLLKAAKRYGIVPVGFIEGQLRPKLPTGQLTLLFADVEGSSRHMTELEDRYGPLLNAVHRIERASLRANTGFEVDARADELFAVFERAPDAVEAAVAIQRGLQRHAWPEGRDVRVRIGLHTGRPTRTTSGYQGLSVNTASRICTCAHGGQILLSRSVRAALADAPPYELRSLGSYRLRGISDEHDLYQLVVPDLHDGFPPLRLDV